MRSFRVHVTEASTKTPTPYLLLGASGDGSVQLDFSPLESEPRHRFPNLSLSLKALYDVIQGQQLRLSRREDFVILSMEDNELVIDCARRDGTHRRQYRVWLAEVALGWNMLRSLPPSGIYLV